MSDDKEREMIEITREVINDRSVADYVRSVDAGAVVTFLGTVRQFTNGRETTSLDYEAYPEMAERKMREIETEAQQRWPILKTAIVHRIGRLALGDVSVAIAVSCPHRGDAFAACQFMMDSIKTSIPIWKCENWANGQSEWVHPGLSVDRVLPRPSP